MFHAQENLSIVSTADGSKSIYHPLVGENYHSKHGAAQESKHVFLKSGLQYFLADKTVNKVSILEIGFGTGLNFLFTADFCSTKELTLNYVGIEAYPLPINFIEETNYNNLVSENTWLAYKSNYNTALKEKVFLNNFCDLHIAHTKLEDFNSEFLFDVIYFDAFAAIHQPEMWDLKAIEHTVKFLKPGGIFVTYAITGNLKRMMKSLGLKVEKAPGAPGKREMLRAIKPNL